MGTSRPEGAVAVAPPGAGLLLARRGEGHVRPQPKPLPRAAHTGHDCSMTSFSRRLGTRHPTHPHPAAVRRRRGVAGCLPAAPW